jgi:hypothetical protein
MDNPTYTEIIKNGERVDWYGIEVPKDLLTNLVVVWSTGLKKEIDKLESSISDLKGISLERRKNYINGLIFNLQNAPYSLNGDVYLKKKKRVEMEVGEKNTKEKKKKVRKRKPKTTKTTKNSRNTKNSDLIFGKNKKTKKK